MLRENAAMFSLGHIEKVRVRKIEYNYFFLDRICQFQYIINGATLWEGKTALYDYGTGSLEQLPKRILSPTMPVLHHKLKAKQPLIT